MAGTPSCNVDQAEPDNNFTVEPPVSDHPTCQDLVVAYESQTRRGLYREQV